MSEAYGSLYEGRAELRRGARVLDPDDVFRRRVPFLDEVSLRELAARYQVHRATMRAACLPPERRGAIYREVPYPGAPGVEPGRRAGFGRPELPGSPGG